MPDRGDLVVKAMVDRLQTTRFVPKGHKFKRAQNGLCKICQCGKDSHKQSQGHWARVKL